MKLPWAPLFTLERSDEPEITIYGSIAIVMGRHKTLTKVGDVHAPLWSRSLLKPWQLLSVLPTLRQNYRRLGSKHYALMLASHNAETNQLASLREILTFGDLNESMLRCPKSMPLSNDKMYEMKLKGEKPKPIYHPCSGKHMAMIMALRANQKPVSGYLNTDSTPYLTLKRLLGYLLDREPDSFMETVDGCKMPNQALSAYEMAYLFWHLVQPYESGQYDEAPLELKPYLESLHEIKTYMLRSPLLVGGSHRLDSELMGGEIIHDKDMTIVAKEGADGLLGVGIAPCRQLPEGVGILIKLSSGYEPAYLRTLIKSILLNLGLKPYLFPDDEMPPEIKIHFHYEIDGSKLTTRFIR